MAAIEWKQISVTLPVLADAKHVSTAILALFLGLVVLKISTGCLFLKGRRSLPDQVCLVVAFLVSPFWPTLFPAYLLICSLCHYVYNRHKESNMYMLIYEGKTASSIQSSNTTAHWGLFVGDYRIHATGSPIVGSGQIDIRPNPDVARASRRLFLGQGSLRRRYQHQADMDADMRADDLLSLGTSCQECAVAFAVCLAKLPLWTFFLSFKQFRWRTLFYLGAALFTVFLSLVLTDAYFLIPSGVINCSLFDELTRVMFFLRYDSSLLIRRSFIHPPRPPNFPFKISSVEAVAEKPTLRFPQIGGIAATVKAVKGVQNDPLEAQLLTAVEEGDVDEVKLLIKQGVDVEAADPAGYVDGWTVLIKAAYDGNTDIVECLLKAGANVSSRSTKSQATPLLWAAANGHTKTVALLLRHGACINEANNSGWTALTWATWEGHEETTRFLLSRGGVTVNQIDGDGWTPLMRASYKGHVDVVNILIDAKADVRYFTPKRENALLLACENGRSATVHTLIRRGADLLAKGQRERTPFIAAALSGDVDTVNVLISEKVDIDARDSNGWTAVVWAAWRGHAAVVEVLLNAKPRREDILIAQREATAQNETREMIARYLRDF